MSGANLLAKLARKLPRLRDAHRTFVNEIQGRVGLVSAEVWVRLNSCEDALGPEPAPALKEAFAALRCALETAQGFTFRRERLELQQLIDGLLSLLEAPEMADVLRRSAETTAAAEPPAAADTPSFSVTIDTAGLTDAEAVMLATGFQLGVQLTLSHGSAASVSPAEIRRAIETHREAQRPRGRLH
jgi:hypothetical protein